EQLDVQQLFQFVDVLADGRLRDKQRLRRAREAARLRDRAEHLQLPKVDGHGPRPQRPAASFTAGPGPSQINTSALNLSAQAITNCPFARCCFSQTGCRQAPLPAAWRHFRRGAFALAPISYSTIRVVHTHGAPSLEYWCEIQSLLPSAGSSSVEIPAGFASSARLRRFRHVHGCVPATSIVGPCSVLGGSPARRHQSSSER